MVLIPESMVSQLGGEITRKMGIRLHAIDGGYGRGREAVELIACAGTDVEGCASGGEEDIWDGGGVFVADPVFFYIYVVRGAKK